MSYYDNTPEAADTTSDALETTEAGTTEENLGDGAAYYGPETETGTEDRPRKYY